MVDKPIAVDEALIETVVRQFYNTVMKDDLLGPIFEKKITDWEPHLKKMFAFWSAVMLQTHRYNGRPMPKHVFLPIDAKHFDRWLSIFQETVQTLCTPHDADLFIYKATHIAKSLEMGVAQKNNVFLKLNERYYAKDN